MKILVAAAMAATVSACGTITRGSNEDVVIQVEPSNAHVTTDIGKSCVGPCVLKVPRKQSFTVTASAPGYEPASVSVGTRVSGGGGTAMAGNIIFGGLIGAGVDVASGAMQDHYPNPVAIVLQPVGSAPAFQPPPATAGPRVGSSQGAGV